MTEAENDRCEIVQDIEIDSVGELGMSMDVFWSYGWHAEDVRSFLDEVITFCLDNEIDVPRITADDVPVQCWQYVREVGDGLELIRAEEPDTDRMYRREWRKVTVLDLEHRGRGARKCTFYRCREPWAVGYPLRIVLSPDEDKNPDDHLEVYLCRKHRKVIPEPSYRVRFVPMGATILLPSTEEDEKEAAL